MLFFLLQILSVALASTAPKALKKEIYIRKLHEDTFISFSLLAIGDGTIDTLDTLIQADHEAMVRISSTPYVRGTKETLYLEYSRLVPLEHLRTDFESEWPAVKVGQVQAIHTRQDHEGYVWISRYSSVPREVKDTNVIPSPALEFSTEVDQHPFWEFRCYPSYNVVSIISNPSQYLRLKSILKPSALHSFWNEDSNKITTLPYLVVSAYRLDPQDGFTVALEFAISQRLHHGEYLQEAKISQQKDQSWILELQFWSKSNETEDLISFMLSHPSMPQVGMYVKPSPLSAQDLKRPKKFEVEVDADGEQESYEVKYLKGLTRVLEEVQSFESLKLSFPGAIKEFEYSLTIPKEANLKAIFLSVCNTLILSEEHPLPGLQMIRAVSGELNQMKFCGTPLLSVSVDRIKATVERNTAISHGLDRMQETYEANSRIHRKLKKRKDQRQIPKQQIAIPKATSSSAKYSIDDEMFEVLRMMEKIALDPEPQPIAVTFVIQVAELISEMQVNATSLSSLFSRVDRVLLISPSFSISQVKVDSPVELTLGFHDFEMMRKKVLGFLSMWVLKPTLFSGVTGISVINLADVFKVTILSREPLADVVKHHLEGLSHLI